MNQIKHITLVALGWIILAIGVAGLFTPFLQGILFIAIGLLLLSARSTFIRTHVTRIRGKSHRLHTLLVRLEEKYPRLFKHHHDHH